MEKDEGSYSLTEKKENFSEWFNQVIQVSGLLEHRYPIKGCEVLMPHGTDILRRSTVLLEEMLKENGNKEVVFPLFIPDSMLKKEGEHIKGFEEEVYYVTHAGKNKLDEKLVLRPTSETAMYPMFSLWVRSHRDLPLKIFQTVSVFRYETKMTKPLVRTREVMFFNESHTCHKDWGDAEAEIKAACNIYSKHISENLAVAFIPSKRPRWDTFPGAVYTRAFDLIMPDGKFMQIGTVHNLGDNFAKAFDIKFKDEKEDIQYAVQTCYGMSTRSLAAIVATHGDDKGLVLPPKIAPIQITIIPIMFKKDGEKVLNHCKDLFARLKGHFRVELDERDEPVGSKFYDWEIKGIPLRIEVGPKEMERNVVTITKRIDGEKSTVNVKNLEEFLENLLKNIQHDMKRIAEQKQKEKIQKALDKEDVIKIINEKKIAEVELCEDEKCAKKLEEETGHHYMGDEKTTEEDKCIICGKPSKYTGHVGRKY